MGSPKNEIKYLISFDLSFQAQVENHQNLIETVIIDAKFEDIGPNIISIAPQGWVFLFGSKDITSEKKKALIKGYLGHFLEEHPRGVIIFIGYNRVKEKSRLFLQELAIDFLLQFEKSFSGILPARSWDDVFLFLTRIAYREQIKDHVPDVGRQKTRKKLLVDAQQFLLEGLSLCGSKKAQTLLDSFGTPLEIMDVILNDPEKIRDLKGFGNLFIKKNQTLLQDHLREE